MTIGVGRIGEAVQAQGQRPRAGFEVGELDPVSGDPSFADSHRIPPSLGGSFTLQAKAPVRKWNLTGAIQERATRIELAFSAWEADVLPLNYARRRDTD
jgi:hypothetical protein